ncbi:phage tail protein [Providencia rettgeri]|nr:phage tail protein [Providencia rettgeri]
MSSVITLNFENWKAQEAATGAPVILDEFVFANVPNLDPMLPIDRNEKLPPQEQIVHRQDVNKTGLASENAVAYSVTLGTEIGDFEFNWIGLLNKSTGVIAMITHAPTQKKIKTHDGMQGNVLTRSFLLEFEGAAKETAINTVAETWQIDFTARLSGIDEIQRQINFDKYGAATFFDDAFLVTQKGNKYIVNTGTAYISGLRGKLENEQSFTNIRDTYIYADFSFQGNLLSQWGTAVKVTESKVLQDYIDNSGFKHYVFAIASIDIDGNVTDLRTKSPIENNIDELQQQISSKLDEETFRDEIPKIQGLVEGWRNVFRDDTDCIDAALSEHKTLVTLERGRTYHVRGGVLYIRAHQTLDFNGATLKLIDNAGVHRLTILEMDDFSRAIGVNIDGNYQNNVDDSATWLKVADIPFAQGIYTSRYLTNNNKFKPAIGAHIESGVVSNCIRSNYVLTGINQYHGELTANHSFADHLIYFSGAEDVRYKKVNISGICRGEAISIGTAGSGVETVSPANKFGGDISIIKNVKKAPIFISGYDEEPIWIQGRNVGKEISGSFGDIYIDDVEIENELHGNGRRISFSGLYNVSINLLVINTVITPILTVNNAYILDSRNGAKVSVAHYSLTAKTREEGYEFPIGPMRADESATLRIGYFKNNFSAPKALNYRNFYVENANIFIDAVNSSQSTGVLFRLFATLQDSSITIGSIERMVGWAKVEEINRLGERKFEGRVRILAMKHLRSPNKSSSETPNVFNVARMELYSEDDGYYYIGAPKNGVAGQTIEIVGDGVAQRGNDQNIIWQGGNDFKFRTIEKGEIIELFLNVDGKWYEKPRNNYGSYVIYRSSPPLGNIVPLYAWQECLDTVNKKWYKATGTSNTGDWVLLN